MSKIDKYISIGFSCGPKFFISTVQDENYYVFDHIGTSMWSIIELINNNFKDFSSKQYMTIMHITKDDKPMYTNTKYYVRFLHEQIKKKFDFKNFKNKYDRRIGRFFKLLEDYGKNNKILCFLRTEENHINRIIPDEHKDKYDEPEYYYLCEFSNLIKNKYPMMKFVIIYINYSEKSDFDKDNNIICFSKMITHDKAPKDFVKHVTKVISDNDTYINKCIDDLYS